MQIVKYSSPEVRVQNYAPTCPESDESKKIYEHYKYSLIWGTYGTGGVEHCNGTCSEHQLRWVRLIDCSSEYLLAILITQHQITSLYRTVIGMILRERKFGIGLPGESIAPRGMNGVSENQSN